jgi:hypothetical protein
VHSGTSGYGAFMASTEDLAADLGVDEGDVGQVELSGWVPQLTCDLCMIASVGAG